VITRRKFVQGLGLATAGSFGFGGYALAEPWGTGVTTYRLSPPGWPARLKLRMAVLADLHVCEPWMGIDRVRGIVEHTNALEPDCVLLLGDYVAGGKMAAYSKLVADAVWAKALAGLKAPQGVHAVLGNHDWWEDGDAVKSLAPLPRAGLALQDAGVPVYENAAVRLEKDGEAFWICGLGDQWAYRSETSKWRRTHGLRLGTDDLGATLAHVHDDAPVVLMAHEPDIFPEVPARVALTVSGHTHGGQVRVMGYAPIVPSRYGDRYVYGHIVEQGRNLIVSGGLGCSGLPVRFGSPPEIVLIELAA
jgi:predicted MPP superfamily phosphohydrolase